MPVTTAIYAAFFFLRVDLHLKVLLLLVEDDCKKQQCINSGAELENEQQKPLPVSYVRTHNRENEHLYMNLREQNCMCHSESGNQLDKLHVVVYVLL